MNRICLILIASIFSLPIVTVSADDWLQFRGNGTGLTSEKGLPTEWSGEKNVAWKAKMSGRGWASPIVSGDKVIIVNAVSADDSLARPSGGGGGKGGFGGGQQFPPDTIYKWYIQCLDRKTGKEVWKQLIQEAKPTIATHRSNTFASETPATDGERIYVYFGMNGLFCYDMDGKKLWKKDLGVFKMQFGWGTSSSPILDGDKLFLQIDSEEKSFLVALNKKTGDEVWRVARSEKSTWSTPFVWKNKERTEIVAGGQKLRSYDPATGKVLWELNAGRGQCSATPVGDEERLYFGLGAAGGGGKGGFGGAPGGPGGGGTSLFAVVAGAFGDISTAGETKKGIAWSQPKAGPPRSSPLVYKGYVYVLEQNGGQISCYNAKTGSPAYQKERIDGARAFWASPWAYDGRVFCLDDAGNTHILEAGPTFKLVGKNSIGDQFWATPALANGTLILRGVKDVYCIKQ